MGCRMARLRDEKYSYLGFQRMSGVILQSGILVAWRSMTIETILKTDTRPRVGRGLARIRKQDWKKLIDSRIVLSWY
jgi:hypothetical protein